MRSLMPAVLGLAAFVLAADGWAKTQPGLRVLDVPAWPKGADAFSVTWTVGPPGLRRGRHGEEIPTIVIKLSVRAGKIERRFSSVASINVGYSIASQRRCQGPGPRNRVAELTLDGGGFQIFALDRYRGQLLLSREVVSDGACDDGPCPVTRTRLARIPVPVGATFAEHFRIHGQPDEETCPQ